MEYGHSIRACFDVWKIAGGGPFGDRGLGVDQGFIAVFWEAVTGRVAVTYNLPFFVAEPADFYMLRFAGGGRVGARTPGLSGNLFAQDVWLITVARVPATFGGATAETISNRHKLSMRAVEILSGFLGGGPRLEDTTPVVPWV
jgi:hypothetical protein